MSSSVFRVFTPQNELLLTSFNKKNDQCIAAHLFCLYIKLLASVFRLFTPQNKLLLTSFNKKNDQCIAAHLFCLYIKFVASVFRLLTPQNKLLMTSFNKKTISASRRIFFAFILFCWLQYFDCLPLKISSL